MTKIKEAQPGMHKREMTINKEAVQRIVNAGLAGNDKWDAENAEAKDRERAAALAKLNALSAKLEGDTKLSKKQRKKHRKVLKEAVAAQREAECDESGEVTAMHDGDEVVMEDAGKGKGKASGNAEIAVEGADDEAEDGEVVEEKQPGPSKRKKQSKSHLKKRRKMAAAAGKE
ncbi:hypothetical protein L873DRAFT_1803650 [Choiromyces venosus 120613-1]|uniref:Uncharacterized protein n=1 Tax=Choiromyces venosus 120613-1 TaxID=1336337 RepID=A0A3N4JTE3_9PEZI|nr:hypothetical protein L873DRAFT_1803650 [Choiromyces venosus 120613-1]